MALTACSDYLDVDAPSSYTTDFVYNSESEVSTALNGVYAKALTGNLFGNALYNNHLLNSDVDFSANSNETANNNQPRRFDINAQSGNVETLWNNLYASVEVANEFIYNLQNGNIYEEGKKDVIAGGEGAIETVEVPEVTALTQMMGEAKVLRAMFYHELISYYGDVPFTLQATYETNNLLPDVAKRQDISDALIADLKHAAEYMYSDTASVIAAPERISQEAAYAMIARLALQAGGYSLNHDEGDKAGYKMTRPDNYQDYYKIAKEYTKKIIDRKGHSLSKDYRDVFIDECNFIVNKGDDAIFEIPFAKESTGFWGYNQGPASGIDTDDASDYSHTQWGATGGSVRTTAFYRYSFEEGDARRDYITGLWYYTNQGLPTMRIDYAMHNNKWSKLWNTAGFAKSSTSNTGINYAYIRYADVLLMFAEADNEVSNGPTQEAKDAVNAVRERAFRGSNVDYKARTQAASSKADFLKLVLDERAHEFAGENMRWKDLVRNNMYGEALVYTFLTYVSVAQNMSGSAPYMDMVNAHAGVDYSEVFPTDIYSCPVMNYNDPNFPNQGVYMRYVYNAYKSTPAPLAKPAEFFEDNNLPYVAVSDRSITGLSSSSNTIGWTTTTLNWGDNGDVKPQCYYSLYGYVRGSDNGNFYIINNGSQTLLDGFVSTTGITATLPAVRYMYPYPEEAIARSAGKYQNYYGY